jgi:hypothetical protein
MSTARKSLLVVLVGVLAACGGSPPSASAPAATGSAVAQGSTGPSNAAFEAFRSGLAALAPPPPNLDAHRAALIAAMDLRATLGSDADKVLAVVAAAEDAARAKSPAHAQASDGAILAMAFVASLPPPAPPPNAELRDVLKNLLDGVGRPGSPAASDASKATASVSDGGLTGTTTMTTDTTATIQGSVAKAEMTREIHSVVTDAAGGQVYDGTRKYKITGQINVCPSVAGVADASVVNTVDENVSTFPGTGGRVGSQATASLSSTSTFRAQVDDQANMGTVSQYYNHNESFKRTAKAEGGPEASHEGSFGVQASGINPGAPSAGDWSLSPGDYSKASGNVSSSGDATQNMITSTVLTAADDFTTIGPSYVEAQRLWRAGRCVVVAVPAYHAETDLDPRNQNLVAHTEEVDKGSSTDFEATLKQRFGDALTASISASLISGKDTLTPSSIAAPPGTLTYKAPDENGKDALVKLVSTSRRGIGTLVLQFHTGPRNLKVTINGKVTSSGGGIKFVTNVSMPSLVLTKQPDGTYKGTGAATASVTVGGICPRPFTEKGTIDMSATRPPVEDQSLPQTWKIKVLKTGKTTTSGACMGFAIPPVTQAGGGYTSLFLAVLGDFEFDEKGGTKTITRSQSFGPMQSTVEATVTGEIVSESG